MSRLLSDMFEDSRDVPILDMRRSIPHSGHSKPSCGPSSKGHLTRSNARPKKDNLYTGGSGDDNNNERT